jgi:hypothetical protein
VLLVRVLVVLAEQILEAEGVVADILIVVVMVDRE